MTRRNSAGSALGCGSAPRPGGPSEGHGERRNEGSRKDPLVRSGEDTRAGAARTMMGDSHENGHRVRPRVGPWVTCALFAAFWLLVVWLVVHFFLFDLSLG